MTVSAGSSPVWGHIEAVDRLRMALLALTDEEHFLCAVAAETGIFCRGFRRFDDREFGRRFRDTLGYSTHLERPEMEKLANVWSSPSRSGGGPALVRRPDARARGTLPGMGEFSHDELARFCADLLGRSVVVA